MAKLKRLNNRRIESPPREPEIFYKGPNAWAMRSPSPLRWNSSRGDYSDERERERIYSYEGFGRTDEAGKKAMKTKIKEQFRSWYRNNPEEAKKQSNPLDHYDISDSEWNLDSEDDESIPGTSSENISSGDETNLEGWPWEGSSSSEGNANEASAGEENSGGVPPSLESPKSGQVDFVKDAENQRRLLVGHEFRLQEEPAYRLSYETEGEGEEEEENARRLREEHHFRLQWEPDYRFRIG